MKNFINKFIFEHAVFSITITGVISFSIIMFILLYNEGYDKGYTQGNYDVLNEIKNNEHDKLFSQLVKNSEVECILKETVLTEKRIRAIMEKSNKKLSDEEQNLYVKYITLYAERYKISPILVASIIHRESNFRHKSTSSVGAAGPMQVWSKWHMDKLKRHKLEAAHLYSIQYGILIGCEVLREYLDTTNENIREALYKYVGGQHHNYIKDIFDMCEYAFNINI